MNMFSPYRVPFVIVLAVAAAGGPAAASAAGAPDLVPLGVYLSWERPPACAKALGTDHWTDVCRRLDALEDNHVNLLWVTNMAEKDLPQLIDECRKRGMKLLPSMSAVEAKVDCSKPRVPPKR